HDALPSHVDNRPFNPLKNLIFALIGVVPVSDRRGSSASLGAEARRAKVAAGRGTSVTWVVSASRRTSARLWRSAACPLWRGAPARDGRRRLAAAVRSGR